MSSSVATLIEQHSTNPCHDTYLMSGSSKTWTKAYSPITNLITHSRVQGDQAVQADFRPFHPEYEDDSLRLQERGNAPNERSYRLNSEEDGVSWFHTEVSNIVLAAFTKYPRLLQTSHDKPISESRDDHTVDVAYSVYTGRTRKHVAIGEFKRGLIAAKEWQQGILDTVPQKSLSQELRGAKTVKDLEDAKCPVDCWVLPRENIRGTTLRYALYRLLVQGFRRCQGEAAVDVALNGQRPSGRCFFDGTPFWKGEDGSKLFEPWNYHRVVEASNGAFYWAHPGGSDPVQYDNGVTAWDTAPFWGFEEQVNEGEDLYSAN
ncbi:hypothetical protein AK830_g12549 [Neonectria ditissima]|uniref:Uncharacterized protein n=1 Tax=Neonectria ditissima TaxID=78410 RepID=A0A0N8H4Q4_9HYPO|nr:hypothetical protein AK830_g12549 [Neonectria ditissima]